LEDNGSRYDSATAGDGLRKLERVRIAMVLRDIEKMKAERLLRREVKRMASRGHSPKQIAKWLRLSIETVEEHLAA
jgi:DNA-binding NarL/FixJ family response regulator